MALSFGQARRGAGADVEVQRRAGLAQSSNYTLASSPNGQERVQQGAYGLVNLMARYQFNRQLSLQVNLNNAFDKKYCSQIGYYGASAWGAPPSVVATLNYRFQ